MELYKKVRLACAEGMSARGAARHFNISRGTVEKMLAFSVPPGYRRSRPPARPKLDPFVSIIDQILEDDKARPAKQRHTSKRIFERLRDEHGFAGGMTIVNGSAPGRSGRNRPCDSQCSYHFASMAAGSKVLSSIGLGLGEAYRK